MVIYRLPRGESVVWPGSHCAACQHPLKALDLIPVLSYLLLKGQCRYCSQKISPRYPLVEIITALLFLLVHWNFAWTVQTLAGCIFTSVLVVVSFTDIEKGIIPDLITYPAAIVGLILSFYTIGIKEALLGALLFSAAFFIVALVSRGGMGGGDIKLAAVIGAFVGLPGIFLVFVISSLLGGFWAIRLLLQGKASRKTAIKFGPFLAVAAWLVWMYGLQMMTFYWGLFV